MLSQHDAGDAEVQGQMIDVEQAGPEAEGPRWSFRRGSVVPIRTYRPKDGGEAQPPASPIKASGRVAVKAPRRPARKTPRPGTPCPRCSKRHRDWWTFARCKWPKTVWLHGCPPKDGPCFASVSDCAPGLSIELHATRAKAEAAKRLMGEVGCGGHACHPVHHAVMVLADEPAPMQVG
jgi:hypothetical protein